MQNLQRTLHSLKSPSCFSFALSICLLIIIGGNPTLGQKALHRHHPSNIRLRSVLERNVRAEMTFLAGDAMQGRGSATGDERLAAEYIGSQFQQFGLEPAGDTDSAGAKGFVQRVPLETGTGWNVVGVLRGSDASAASEAVILSAHLDHLGVGHPVDGDAIYNGADDDASGCVAVLELARYLVASRPRPRRSVYLVCFGSEEKGGFGARYFIEHPPVPLNRIVANLEFEMIGRPDPKVPAHTLWLTGYERSNLGAELAAHGARLVADPHPEQNFFQRSDNYTLALRGVVAQTVSGFVLHSDYHLPSDDVSKINFRFMTRAINSLLSPVRWLLSSGFRAKWVAGRAPTRS